MDQVEYMSKSVVSVQHDESIIFPIVHADRLLAHSGHQELLRNIETTIAQDESRYTLLYEPLIHQFVEYVQVLNDQAKKQTSMLLNTGLERAWYITRDYIKDHGDDTDFVYLFALFSAALLLDVGRVDFNRKIDICTQKGVFLKEWLPVRRPEKMLKRK